MKHLGTKARWSVLLVALAVAAGGAAAAAAGGGDLAKQVAALKRQLKALTAQNKRLDDQFSPAGIRRQLAKTKAALDKYQDVERAKADGYKAESPCESTPTDPEATWWGGAMGIHYVDDQVLMSGKLDPARPPILTYGPTAGGGLKLLAAE
jgi:hypothetical protein